MELLESQLSQVTEATYILQDPDEGVLIYKEWAEMNGKVIDFVLRSKDGHEIDDPALVERVQEYVDSITVR